MNKWIKVEDRLPKDHKLKVIKYSADRRHIGISLARRFIPSNIKVEMWDFEFSNTQSCEVTHWCDLPKDEK